VSCGLGGSIPPVATHPRLYAKAEAKAKGKVTAEEPVEEELEELPFMDEVRKGTGWGGLWRC
jgi:hypothetical protein